MLEPELPDDSEHPLVDVSRTLLRYSERRPFIADTAYEQIVIGTVGRSRETYIASCELVNNGLPRQAAMLNRSLLEDVIVGHWLLLNQGDHDWLVDRFFRHRDAIALHQARLAADTQWAMGPPLVPITADLTRRQNALIEDFGAEAQRDWWDPGRGGDGSGAPVGLRGIARRLEEAAEAGIRFNPRFAGGDESLLRRWERVVQKWFSQILHHTAVGLPIRPERQSLVVPDLAHDPSPMVLFSGFWMFAQQIYLALELHDEDTTEFDDIFRGCWQALGFEDVENPAPDDYPGWNR